MDIESLQPRGVLSVLTADCWSIGNTTSFWCAKLRGSLCQEVFGNVGVTIGPFLGGCLDLEVVGWVAPSLPAPFELLFAKEYSSNMEVFEGLGYGGRSHGADYFHIWGIGTVAIKFTKVTKAIEDSRDCTWHMGSKGQEIMMESLRFGAADSILDCWISRSRVTLGMIRFLRSFDWIFRSGHSIPNQANRRHAM